MAKLTERYLDAMVPPATGSRHVYDDEVTGFGVRHFAATKRHPKGLKTFILDDHGKRDKIGRHGVWTVLAAREEAKELRRRIDRGQDPFGEKRARKLAPTVADLAERYKLEHLPRKAEVVTARRLANDQEAHSATPWRAQGGRHSSRRHRGLAQGDLGDGSPYTGQPRRIGSLENV